jgi:hypothetical protein
MRKALLIFLLIPSCTVAGRAYDALKAAGLQQININTEVASTCDGASSGVAFEAIRVDGSLVIGTVCCSSAFEDCRVVFGARAVLGQDIS